MSAFQFNFPVCESFPWDYGLSWGSRTSWKIWFWRQQADLQHWFLLKASVIQHLSPRKDLTSVR